MFGRSRLLYKSLCPLIIQSKISTIRGSNWIAVIIQMQTMKRQLNPMMMKRLKWLCLQMILWNKTRMTNGSNQIDIVLWSKNRMYSQRAFTTLWRYITGSHGLVYILSIIALVALIVLTMILWTKICIITISVISWTTMISCRSIV